jgi:hypothetical protein
MKTIKGKKPSKRLSDIYTQNCNQGKVETWKDSAPENDNQDM